MNVDLPAPLGPRSPVTPGGTETFTSFRPMTWPYHLETCSVVTTGRVRLEADSTGVPLEADSTGVMSPPPRRGRAARYSSGGLRPAGPPGTLARGGPRGPR